MTMAREILTKWRNVYYLWSHQKTEKAQEKYAKDQAEKWLLLRAEQNAIVALCLQKGIFTQLEFTAQVDVEAEYVSAQQAGRFPGFEATEYGLKINNPEAGETIRNWSK